ncbi:MAG: ribosome maturation factor RimP [Coriobacteriia bacterium]|nr:ribosome maturation factor RimP [Coriobacteriia bacterium]
MKFKELKEQMIALLEPLAEESGYELVDIDISGSMSNPVIAVMLDHPQGIDLEKIVTANEWVDAALDEADFIGSSYILEVSSPGINRPLRKAEDFVRFSGSDVHIKIDAPKGKQANFKGVLKGIDKDAVRIECEDVLREIKFDSIISARLSTKIDFKSGERK